MMAAPKEPVAVYLDPELKQRFREHAARQRRSMSALIEILVQAEMSLADGLSAENAREAELFDVITGEHDAIPECPVCGGAHTDHELGDVFDGDYELGDMP